MPAPQPKKRKQVRGSYDRYGVWVSAAEKREEAENKRLYGGRGGY